MRRALPSLFVLPLAFAQAASVLAQAAPVRAQDAAVQVPVREQEATSAVVVLVGEAGQSAELSAVIRELLLRQGLVAQIEARPRFEPEVWLDTSAADPRAFAFVVLESEQRAQLYFRGPRGERFLRRELTLRDGLDEVGRELIARVLETSTDALLHSSEGLSRDEARAGLAQDAPAIEPPSAPAEPEPAPPRAAAPREPAQALDVLLGARVLGHLTGEDLGARLAAGLELAVAWHAPGWPRLRARIELEASLPQTLQAESADASILSFPMRAGFEIGTSFDLYVGLLTGFDLVHLQPDELRDEDLVLAEASTELVPSSRAEVRYEIALSRGLWLGLSALVDVPWTATHYEVVRAGTRQRIASPWALQPGIALTCIGQL
jgi:hypothetical protein